MVYLLVGSATKTELERMNKAHGQILQRSMYHKLPRDHLQRTYDKNNIPTFIELLARELLWEEFRQLRITPPLRNVVDCFQSTVVSRKSSLRSLHKIFSGFGTSVFSETLSSNECPELLSNYYNLE